MENISSALLDWFYKNHRILPFRTDPSPYHVWLSEIMLQQTRVSAALPYYERFLAALPDIPALAACEEEKLHKLWEGLGYYSRVRNLQKAARIVCEQYGGQLPADYDALRALRSRKDMVILLNEEGALIREDWHWSLLFTPNRSEKRTLGDSSDLYQVLCSLAQRRQDGEVCRVAVPDRSLKTLVSGSDPFCILDEFCKSQPGGYLAVAQNIVLEGTDHLFRHVPVCRYRVLSTVDLGEIENYHAIKTLLDEYIYAYDHRDAGEDAPKPISIAVFGPPGSGKSFGVKHGVRTSSTQASDSPTGPTMCATIWFCRRTASAALSAPRTTTARRSPTSTTGTPRV